MTPVREELAQLVRLGGPLVATQVAFYMIAVVDSILLGHVSAEALGATALAAQWSWTWLSIGFGIVLGIDPLISQAAGSGDHDATELALQRGLVVSVLVGVPVALLHLVTGPGLILLGQPREVAELAQTYNVVRAPSVFFFYFFTALRSWLSSRSLVRPAMWTGLFMNVLNLGFGAALIFGYWGFPRLEVLGAAIVASLAGIAQPIALWIFVRARGLDEGLRLWPSARAWERAGLGQIFRLGFPVGLQLTFEGTAFSLASIMSGWLGVTALAAHNVVLSLIALWFQVPLGIAIAASVRVGNAIGRGDLEGARRSAAVSLGAGAAVMSISALALAVFRFGLPSIYTDELQVIALAATIAPVAAAFQLFDGVQVVAAAILRGAGRTTFPAAIQFLGYWAFGLPASWALGFAAGYELAGIWWGLALGLLIVSSLLVLRVRQAGALPLAELQVRVR